MLTFKYKDMRVRYQYMLALASLSLLQMVLSNLTIVANLSSGVILSAIIIYLPILIVPLVLIFISLRALSYKVKFSDDTVTLNNTKIQLAQIDRIKFSEQEPSYTVQYCESKSRKIKMGLQDSDEDTGTFRQALSELISRVRQSNPKVKINQDTTDSLAPGTKVYEKVTKRIREEKVKLTGIGGWLIYIIGFLLSGGFVYIMDVTAKRPAIPVNGNIGILLYYILCASIVLFALINLVLLFQKRKSFKKTFIVFLAYRLVASEIILALKYTLIDGKWPGTIGIINGFVIGVIYNVIFVFAWRAYFQRSIRVKNTFPDGISTTKTN